MYDRLTHQALKVLQFAIAGAQRYNHECIDTEHILLAFVRVSRVAAIGVLRDLDSVRNEMEQRLQPGPEFKSGRRPQSAKARRVVEGAMLEATCLGHDEVAPEHLLLGLMREETGLAAQVLAKLGLSLDELRQQTRKLLGPGTAPAELAMQPESVEALKLHLKERLQLLPTTVKLTAELEAQLPRVLREVVDELFPSQDRPPT